MNPLVSIIVPCYNQAQYLPETLDSVFAQTYQNWECIIVNDGSPDNTDEIAKQYCDKDSRFKYIYKENGGPASARNFGVRNSVGEYILPLDSDDIISIDYLKTVIQHFDKFPDTKLVYCRVEFFGEKSGEWILPQYNYVLLLLHNIIFCSAVYKREDFDRTAGYNENFIEGLEDWEFWLSLLDSDSIVFQIPIIHFHYRIRNKSRNDNVNEEMLLMLKRRIYEVHMLKYEKFIPQLIWQNPDINHLILRIKTLENELINARNSKSYRLGKFILKPINFIKKISKIRG